jgi:tetratricopeptide (TPR) repeat protein
MGRAATTAAGGAGLIVSRNPLLGVRASVVPCRGRGVKELLPPAPSSGFLPLPTVAAAVYIFSPQSVPFFGPRRSPAAAAPQTTTAPLTTTSTTTVDQALASGVAHHQAGRLDEAEAAYGAILAEFPKHFNALHLSGLIRHRRGEHAAAAAMIEQALAEEPSFAAAWFNLGNVRRAMGDAVAAAAAYGEASRLTPDFTPAVAGQGLMLAALGRHAEAVGPLAAASVRDPGAYDVCFALAQAREALGEWEGAEAAFRRASCLSPATLTGWLRYGQASLKRERLATAERALERAVRLDPANLEAQFDRARLMEALRVWDRAAEALAVVTSRTVLDVGLRVRLGTALRNAGAPAARVEQALAAVAGADGDGATEALVLLGLNARDAGDPVRAVEFFRQALARRPHHSTARFHRGVTAMLTGVPRGEAFPDAESFAPAYAERGDQLAAEGRLKDACAFYLEASLINPDLKAARDGMAATLAERRRLCRFGEMADKDHTDEWGNIALYDAMDKYNRAVVADPYLIGAPRPGAFRRPRVFDCFTFYNELDLLEMRLEELNDVVDFFVAVEAPWTFQGQPKSLILKENMARFERFAHKIVHVVVDDAPDAGPSPWDREGVQRDAILRGLAGRAAPDDLIFVGDVDEMPRRATVTYLRDDPARAGRLNRLSADYYCGFLDFKCNYRWHKQIALPYSLLLALGPDHARFLAIAKYGNLVYDAGWHFSWLGGAEKIVGKLRAYAHSEYTGLADLDAQALMQAMRSGGGIFALMDSSHGYGGEFSVTQLDDGFPEVVRRDPDRYRKMGWLF